MRITRAQFAFALALTSAVAAQGPDPVGAAPDFARDVWPILDARCVSCHGPQKNGREPKGGLRLDGIDWIRAGGDGGAVVTARDPDDSPLYTLTLLDGDDPDIMPAKGAPLTDAQRATLRAWIEAGASFGSWTGSGGPADIEAAAAAPVPPHRQHWQELAHGLEPLPASKLEAWRKVATIRPVLPDLPLLRVSFRAREGGVDAALLRRLGELDQHAVELDVSRVELPAGALTNLGSWPRLEHLSLANGSFRKGLPQATALPRLRSLNLFGTGVGSAILEELERFPDLEVVYLGGTAIPADMLREWAAARPGLRVVGAADLPPAEPAEAPWAGRRR